MGLNTIPTRVGTILSTFWDDIRTRWIGDFVGMDASGAPVAGCNLGNPLYPWGAAYFGSAVIGGAALDLSQIETQPYKLVRGKTRSGSNQPDFLRAAGSGTNFTVLATSVPLILQVAGVVSSSWVLDKAVAGTVAPSSQNTATVNDATYTSQAASRIAGEYGSASAFSSSGSYYGITVSSAGTNITNKVGTWQAFKVGTEYFLAYIDSATLLARAFRGYFLDSSGNPVKRATIANGATITLMSLGWVFLDSDGTTVDTTYNNPTFSYTAPSSPATADYWFDQANQIWKRYNGSSFVQVNRILAGLVVLDATNCVATRSFDFFALNRADNTCEMTVASTARLALTGANQRVTVNGKKIFFGTQPVWTTTTNLGAASERYNASIQANSTEYAYVTDQGDFVYIDTEPYWRADLLGWYHPHNPWRCIAQVATDGSAHFLSATIGNYGPTNLLPTFSQVQIGKVGGPWLSQFLTDTLTACLGLRPLVVSASPSATGLLIVRGYVSSAGALGRGEGFTVSRLATGFYDIVFPSGTFAEVPVVVPSAENVGVAYAEVSTSNYAPTATTVQIMTTNNAGAAANSAFHFIAIGQRGS